MNIFMVTRPISPLMDEGSKNLAFNLCTQIKSHKFHLMTYKNANLPKIDNIMYHKLHSDYTLNDFNVHLFDKAMLFYKLFNLKNIDIYHFIFTPRVASSQAIRIFFRSSKKKTIQTIPTLLTDSELKKCLFADKIIVLSEWTKNKILSLGYDNVIKINPGIDLDKFLKNKIPNIRKKFNISKEEFVILFPSEYNIRRGTRIFLKTIKKLIDSFSKTRIIFACRIMGRKDLEERNFLIKSIDGMHLSDKVIFLDHIDYMHEVINSSDIVIFPTISPFFKMEIPMVLLESLALEKPIIISDTPPLNEILSKNEAGIKIKCGDSEALLNNIIKLIKNKQLKNRMGKAGRALVKKEFNIKNIAQEYKTLYEELR